MSRKRGQQASEFIIITGIVLAVVAAFTQIDFGIGSLSQQQFDVVSQEALKTYPVGVTDHGFSPECPYIRLVNNEQFPISINNMYFGDQNTSIVTVPTELDTLESAYFYVCNISEEEEAQYSYSLTVQYTDANTGDPYSLVNENYVLQGTYGSLESYQTCPAVNASWCYNISCQEFNYYNISGTQGAMTVSYCNETNFGTTIFNACTPSYMCSVTNYTDYCPAGVAVTAATAGTCEYIDTCEVGSQTVGYYDTATACSSTQDCDTNNYYFMNGTQSPNETSYCQYRDYEDITQFCDGAGTCNALNCNVYTDLLTAAEANICEYISGCSDSTPGAIENYSDTTVCGELTSCDGNDTYTISGTQSSTTTSYCIFSDYTEDYPLCDGLGTCLSAACETYSNSTVATAATCAYIDSCSSSAQTVGYYDTATACSGTQDCDTYDNYTLTGIKSATTTETCTLYDFTDTTRFCNGAGTCSALSCINPAVSTYATAEVCQYVQSGTCTGTTPATVLNYNTATTCSGTQDCDYLDTYWEDGIDSATGTNYCKYTDYTDTTRFCDGSGSCAALNCGSGSTTTLATAGICKYVDTCSSASQTVGYYDTTTVCSATQDCDTSNYYFEDGTDSATGTNYCKYRDYEDVARFCDGAGTCSALSCTSYSDSTVKSAGVCQYISACSSSAQTISDYAYGTSCGEGRICDGAGSCIESFACGEWEGGGEDGHRPYSNTYGGDSGYIIQTWVSQSVCHSLCEENECTVCGWYSQEEYDLYVGDGEHPADRCVCCDEPDCVIISSTTDGRYATSCG